MISITQSQKESKSIIRVSRSNPCPICDKPDWCGVFEDGSAAICMRIESSHPTQNGGWLHFLSEKSSSFHRPFVVAPTLSSASPETRHEVYRSLIEELSLSQPHFQALLHRGLTSEEVLSLRNQGYVTLPEGLSRARVMNQLIASYGAKLLKVPGFYLTRKNRLWLAGESGMICPCRDVQGRIVGAQVRVDNAQGGGKYRWLSATQRQRKKGGVGSGCPLHVARGAQSERVWITEGILKADISALKLKETVIGVAGVSSWKKQELQETLQALKPKEVIIAFDADLSTNKAVRQQRMRLGKTLLAMGYSVRLASWNPSQGKGLDDLLVAGHTPQIEPFRPAPNLNALKSSPKHLGKKRVKRIEPESESASQSNPSSSDRGLSNPRSIIPSSTIEQVSPTEILLVAGKKTIDVFPRRFLRETSAPVRKTSDSGLPSPRSMIPSTLPQAERMETPACPDIPTLRQLMAEDMEKFLMSANGGVRLYRATQGLGKTFTALEGAHRLWEMGVIRPVYAAPRHDLIEENLRFPWQHIQPRKPLSKVPPDMQPLLCPHWERASALGARRWNVVQEFCVKDCEIGTSCGIHACPYFQQYNRLEPLATVHETLFVPFFCDSIFQNPNFPHLGVNGQAVLFDEPSPDKFVERVDITTAELSKAIARCRDKDLKNLLRLLRQTAEDVVSERTPASAGANQQTKGKRFERLIGRQAMEALIFKAGGEEVFEKLLKAASDAAREEIDTVLVEVELMGETKKAWEVVLQGKKRYFPKSVADPSQTGMMRVAKWFAQKEGLQEAKQTQTEANEIPLNFQSDLMNVLLRDLSKYKTGEPYNSALVITRTFLPTIRLNLFREFAVPSHVPVLLLDGQGDAKLLSMLLKRNVTVYDAECLPNVEILQVIDGCYGITTLWNSKTKEPKRSFWRLWDNLIMPIVAIQPSDTLLITWKVVADYLRNLQEKGKIPPSLAIEHYDNVSGTNAHQDRKTAIALGTPQVSPEDVLEQAHALFVDGEPLNPEVIETWREYDYTDSLGNRYATQVKTYSDERLEMLARLHRENEIVQAIHRIRPMLSEGKRIILLTGMPLEELPPTRLYTVSELQEEFGSAQEQSRGVTFASAEELASSLMEENGAVWFENLKTALQQRFLTSTKRNIPSGRENRQETKDFPPDSTLYRWLSKIAKQENWLGARVTIERLTRGGGASWIVVYHTGELSEEYVRWHYAAEWDISPEYPVQIEPWPLTTEELEETSMEMVLYLSGRRSPPGNPLPEPSEDSLVPRFGWGVLATTRQKEATQLNLFRLAQRHRDPTAV